MTTPAIGPDMSVDEIMRRWPATIRVMIRHRMLCIGCPIGIFHTVADAAAAHAMDEANLARELLVTVRSGQPADAPSAGEANAHEEDPRDGEQSCT